MFSLLKLFRACAFALILSLFFLGSIQAFAALKNSNAASNEAGKKPSPEVHQVLTQLSKRYKLNDSQKEQLLPILIKEHAKVTEVLENQSLTYVEKKRRLRSLHQESTAGIAEIMDAAQFAKYEKDQAKLQESDQDQGEPDGPPGPPPDGGGPGGGGPPPPM